MLSMQRQVRPGAVKSMLQFLIDNSPSIDKISVVAGAVHVPYESARLFHGASEVFVTTQIATWPIAEWTRALPRYASCRNGSLSSSSRESKRATTRLNHGAGVFEEAVRAFPVDTDIGVKNPPPSVAPTLKE